jgi:3-oxoacyl-[acyl-carrier-protein] synthase-3
MLSAFDVDPDLADLVEVPGGGTREPLSAESIADGRDRFHMQGREVAEYARTALPEVVARLLRGSGYAVGDVALWVMHQANPVLLGEIVKDVGIDPARVPLTAPRYGNSGAASIAVTLGEAVAAGKLARGDLVVFGAIGGGMATGAVLMRWY